MAAWYEELDAAVKSMNGTEHTALFNRDPDDVAQDEDLEFDLRYKNAEMRQHNVDLARVQNLCGANFQTASGPAELVGTSPRGAVCGF